MIGTTRYYLLLVSSFLAVTTCQASLELRQVVTTDDSNTDACSSYSIETSLNKGETLQLTAAAAPSSSSSSEQGSSPCGPTQTGGHYYNFLGDGNPIRIDTCNDDDDDGYQNHDWKVYVWEGICDIGGPLGVFFGKCVGAFTYEDDGCTLVLAKTKNSKPYTLFIEAPETTKVWITRGLTTTSTTTVDTTYSIVSNGQCDNASRQRLPQDGTPFTTDLEDYVSPYSVTNYCGTTTTGGGSIGLWYYFNTPKFNVERVDYAVTICVDANANNDDDDDDALNKPSLFSGSCNDLTCIDPTSSYDNDDNTNGIVVPNHCSSGTVPRSTLFRLTAGGKRYSILIPKTSEITKIYLNDLKTDFASNDECENAVPLEDNAVTTGSLEGASSENVLDMIGPFGSGGGGKDVVPTGIWYKMEPNANQRSLTIDPGVFSMMVYKGDCGNHNTPPNLVTGYAGRSSVVTFLQTTVPVYVFVYGTVNHILQNPEFTITSTVADGFTFACFAGHQPVNVLLLKEGGDDGRTTTTRTTTKKLMKDVQIGDIVQSSTSGKFSEVYSLGHVNHDVWTDYTQLHTATTTTTKGRNTNRNNKLVLELTPNHMVWVQNKNRMVPASLVQVGDQVADGFTFACFAGHQPVNVLLLKEGGDDGRTTTTRTTTKKLMKDVQIGDIVQSSTSGKFSEVYSLGHVNHDVWTDYTQLHTTTTKGRNTNRNKKLVLELTPNHMVWVQNKNRMVPASLVQVGDQVLIENNNKNDEIVVPVTKITTVVRQGAYAPLTKDGSIVVNGVYASCYPTLVQDQTTLGGLVNMHTVSHFILTVRRYFFNNNNEEEEETYTEEGIAMWASQLLPMAVFLVDYANILLVLLFGVVVVVVTSHVVVVRRLGRQQNNDGQYYGYKLKML
eukprot:CAMPEP_0194260836 /NCGR_PEP_ID=MMETSP0158-20130606/45714_1 /TAXON_ID=33649 /ORGANISM="Thalassionema nitzschioides, Strain L26-B" /LENGTH=892 /DNA_ID=CAMNT_0039000939 /DNA_START=104 /DNA_END=2783 /DNA_ORIENTATION=+